MNVRSFSLGMRNLGVLILALCLLMGAACNPCENAESAEHRSPDGAWKAVVFERGCGATVGPNVQMSILPSSDRLPDGAGNTFVIDNNGGSSAQQSVYVDWTSNNSIRITYPSNARVSKQEKRVGKVDVTYVAK